MSGLSAGKRLLAQHCECVVVDGLEPLVAAALARDFNGDMRKPAVGFGAVPMLDARRDCHDCTGNELACRLSFLLIPPFAGGADQDLSAT